ncbi:MAG TPA: hypothetical protein VK720_05715 [Terracidiphilus sp.]|nr:hypothetical protein [Terracidiphilus sp.]
MLTTSHRSHNRNLGRYFLWLPIFGLTCVVTARPAGQNFPYHKAPDSTIPGMADADPVAAARQIQALNAERQKSMISDTDKLLKLAKELNKDVDSNPDRLTQGELHKLADIEKLARNVKEKMSVSFIGGPTYQEPSIPGQPSTNPSMNPIVH